MDLLTGDSASATRSSEQELAPETPWSESCRKSNQTIVAVVMAIPASLPCGRTDEPGISTQSRGPGWLCDRLPAMGHTQQLRSCTPLQTAGRAKCTKPSSLLFVQLVLSLGHNSNVRGTHRLAAPLSPCLCSGVQHDALPAWGSTCCSHVAASSLQTLICSWLPGRLPSDSSLDAFPIALAR